MTWAFFVSRQLMWDEVCKLVWDITDTINLHLALLFLLGGLFLQLTVRQIKYLNNIVEQDHRFIKKITKTMKGFKAFHSADATLAGF